MKEVTITTTTTTYRHNPPGPSPTLDSNLSELDTLLEDLSTSKYNSYTDRKGEGPWAVLGEGGRAKWSLIISSLRPRFSARITKITEISHQYQWASGSLQESIAYGQCWKWWFARYASNRGEPSRWVAERCSSWKIQVYIYQTTSICHFYAFSLWIINCKPDVHSDYPKKNFFCACVRVCGCVNNDNRNPERQTVTVMTTRTTQQRPLSPVTSHPSQAPSASSATRELDDLMASLSDFKVGLCLRLFLLRKLSSLFRSYRTSCPFHWSLVTSSLLLMRVCGVCVMWTSIKQLNKRVNRMNERDIFLRLGRWTRHKWWPWCV